MAKSQFRSVKKTSGRKYLTFRKKRLSDLGADPALTHIGKSRVRVKRVRGGNIKRSLLSKEKVLVNKGGATLSLEIQGVAQNPANVNYTRRNIITKGCIVKTAQGDVRITSRPGQSGDLSGVFVQ
ncbi:30S ribosomal protein S8e [Candidatus Woesearchaeota archaeon]|nr:30S ribosomal protein S8e [Nanoarchaeota archaeon]MCB9370465.1 30S ribosomal protein S8e [Candidatus Woesearchaeota archaeon]USN43544.1 MAG: 30S ribosomal protein S8e [Candidatus Woesearchaeota archaeon]